MTSLPARVISLDLLADESLSRDKLGDLIWLTGSAAEKLFQAGDLWGSLAYWDLAIASVRRYGVAENRLSGFLFGRAKALDHLDDLDRALVSYEEAHGAFEAEGRARVNDFVDADIARIRRKIEARDTGRPFRTHSRGIRPFALDWARRDMAELLMRVSDAWKRRERIAAEDAVREAEEAAEEEWRADADPTVLAEYLAICTEVDALLDRALVIEVYHDPFGFDVHVDEEVKARAEALLAQAGELSQRPLRADEVGARSKEQAS